MQEFLAQTIVGMSVGGWISVGTIFCVFAALVMTRYSPDMILLGGLLFLMTIGVVKPELGLMGFANEGLATVAALFIVAAGIRETGAVNFLVDGILKRPKSIPSAQIRLMLPVMALSGFVNNTPLVAVLIPAVNDWARKVRFSVSKLLIPLSYAAILGGMCTLIGTSTNLIVDGMVREKIRLGNEAMVGFAPLGFFELSKVGVPLAILGGLFIIGTSKWLLPNRTSPVEIEVDPREYVLEMIVEAGSPLTGQTIEQAGLRSLPGVFLAEIERGGELLPAVSPRQRLEANDRLMFVGVVESVVDLQRIRGLVPATDQLFKLNAPKSSRILIEAVVSNSSPLVGKSIREGRFRTVYDAVVIAVARNGERIKGKIGDIVLRPGDTLLLEAPREFIIRQRNSRHFYLVSEIEGYVAPRHERAWMSLMIVTAMVVGAAFFRVPMVVAAALAAGATVLTRCLTAEGARRSLELRVLFTIGAALGLGKALEVTGASSTIANGVISLAGSSPLLVFMAIYLLTALFTEMITNNAAAILMFEIAVASARELGVDLRPFVIGIMIASSASFATPIGYQTNLMVYGPGGYRFKDFVKIGVPLGLLLFLGASFLIPKVFPFYPSLP